MKRFLTVLKWALVITFVVAIFDIVIFGDGDYSWEHVSGQLLIDFIFSFSLTAVNSYYYDGLKLRF
ncbi:MAG: hypothetical protein AAGH81_03890, partial [Bacteroidota bacterium]